MPAGSGSTGDRLSKRSLGHALSGDTGKGWADTGWTDAYSRKVLGNLKTPRSSELTFAQGQF